jgi:hypothetical protein
MSAAQDLVRASWDAPAAWLLDLARAVDAEGGALPQAQKKIAARIGYSNAVVHEVLRNRYRGDLSKVAARVARHLTAEAATCPVLGVIPHEECRSHQARRAPGPTPLRVKLWQACRAGCAHSFIEVKGGQNAE